MERGFGITAGVFAVASDIASLNKLRRIRPHHKILLGNQATGSETPFEVKGLIVETSGENHEKLLHAIGNTEGFMETDAFFLISGAAGVTGSGLVPLLTQQLKKWHPEKPVYALTVLPFEDEEKKDERTIFNTVSALKSAFEAADAVFLIDNQRFVAKDFFVRDNLEKVNAAIVETFYETLCAGEEKNPRYIGAKTLDAGDIINTLSGWTVIGEGRVHLPKFRLPFKKRTDFKEKLDEMQKGIKALDGALSELSLKCNPAGARRALYLLAAPSGEMGLNLFTNLGASVKIAASEAIIRSGDYPRPRDSVSVTLILSELESADKVSEYFSRAGGRVILPVPPVAGPSAQPESPQPDEQADEGEESI